MNRREKDGAVLIVETLSSCASQRIWKLPNGDQEIETWTWERTEPVKSVEIIPAEKSS